MAAITNTPILRQLGQLASNPMMLAALTQNPMILQVFDCQKRFY
jgi:hypothetical protein